MLDASEAAAKPKLQDVASDRPFEAVLRLVAPHGRADGAAEATVDHSGQAAAQKQHVAG